MKDVKQKLDLLSTFKATRKNSVKLLGLLLDAALAIAPVIVAVKPTPENLVIQSKKDERQTSSGK